MRKVKIPKITLGKVELPRVAFGSPRSTKPVPTEGNYLLLENGGYLLLENGGRIMLEK